MRQSKAFGRRIQIRVSNYPVVLNCQVCVFRKIQKKAAPSFELTRERGNLRMGNVSIKRTSIAHISRVAQIYPPSVPTLTRPGPASGSRATSPGDGRGNKPSPFSPRGEGGRRPDEGAFSPRGRSVGPQAHRTAGLLPSREKVAAGRMRGAFSPTREKVAAGNPVRHSGCSIGPREWDRLKRGQVQ